MIVDHGTKTNAIDIVSDGYRETLLTLTLEPLTKAPSIISTSIAIDAVESLSGAPDGGGNCLSFKVQRAGSPGIIAEETYACNTTSLSA